MSRPPAPARTRFYFAETHTLLAEVLLKKGDAGGALTECEEALPVYEILVAEDVTNADYRRSLANALFIGAQAEMKFAANRQVERLRHARTLRTQLRDVHRVARQKHARRRVPRTPRRNSQMRSRARRKLKRFLFADNYKGASPSLKFQRRGCAFTRNLNNTFNRRDNSPVRVFPSISGDNLRRGRTCLPERFPSQRDV